MIESPRFPHIVDKVGSDKEGEDQILFEDEDLAEDCRSMMKPFVVDQPSGENEDLVLKVVYAGEDSGEWEIQLQVIHYYVDEALDQIENTLSQAVVESRRFEKYWRNEALDPYLPDSEDIIALVNQTSLRYNLAGEDSREKDLVTKIQLGLFHYKNVEIPQDRSKISQN